MTESDLDPDAQPVAADAPAEPAPRPRRRRAAPAVPTDDPATVTEAAAAPKRRVRRKIEASDVVPVETPPAATIEPAAATADLPPQVTAPPIAAAAESGSAVVEATPAGAPEVTTAANAATAAATQRADRGAGELSEPNRRRNRRRGRRGTGASAEGGGGGGGDGGGESGDGAMVVTVDASDDDEADEAGPAVADREPKPDAEAAFAYVRSADFDTEPVPTDSERRVLAAEPDAPKLHKVLAQAGIGSRRDMEELIAAGQVKVNGQVAHTGQRVSFGDRIAVGGRLIKVRIVPPASRVIAYHKPAGEVVTRDDPQQRPTVFRQLPRLAHGKWQSVGRLDINTEGLLLFTNSGELANQLMHPRFGVEREYAVRVIGRLDDDARARLLEGVDIDGQRAAFKSIADGGGEGLNHWYRAVITEGRNREVRRMFDRVGLSVSRLIRIRYGCVVLPRGLKRGACVDLSSRDVAQLHTLASPQGPREGARPPEGGGGRNKRRGNRGGGNRGPGDRPAEQRPRHPDSDDIDYGSIPNPLQQTFDKRAIREARQPRRDIPEDGPIPNPLEQTYDRRFVQKPRASSSGERSPKGGQPDPMKTSVGYIGADAFVRKFQGGSGGRWGGKRGGGGRR